MASKKDEMRAFKKLKAAFPGHSVQISMSMWKHGHRDEDSPITYTAYYGLYKGSMLCSQMLSCGYPNPMDAVDELILKSKSVS